jgi:hypothetical protein
VFAVLTFALSGGYLQAPAVVTPPPAPAAVVAQAAVTVGSETVTQERTAVETERPAEVVVTGPLWNVSSTPGAVPAGTVPATAGSRGPPTV